MADVKLKPNSNNPLVQGKWKAFYQLYYVTATMIQLHSDTIEKLFNFKATKDW
jgi:hypothetical protein